jgi:hypothetical protein
MTTYYIEKDNKIVLHDTDKNRIETTLKFMPQYAKLKIKETERPIENGEFADTDEYIAKKAHKLLEAQVASLEAASGLIRPLREMVLSENSGASDYVKSKAQEIEDLAAQLRG